MSQSLKWHPCSLALLGSSWHYLSLARSVGEGMTAVSNSVISDASNAALCVHVTDNCYFKWILLNDI